VRVRIFELRLIGVALVASWTLTAALVLLAYRPGGPIDLLVGLLASGPLAIAVVGVVWPPLAHGKRAFPAMMWLGISALLLLMPSMSGLLTQLRAMGSQTLVPSIEAAYPWFLALLATSLFAGFGLASRTLGQTAMRRRRLARGLLIGLALTVLTGVLFTGAAVANDFALRDLVPDSSRFGPTDPDAEVALCDGSIAVGPDAEVDLDMTAQVDLRPIGSIELTGVRHDTDYRWVAYVATDREIGTYGWARIGTRTWSRTPGRSWFSVDNPAPERMALDRHAVELALVEGFRATAEDHGIEVIEGARARRCRVAVDGSTFADAFPQVRLLVGAANLERWRGQLDYWIFLDGQIGQITGRANGEAFGFAHNALQATVELRLTATHRDRVVSVYPPAR
jgi:hypothetical protein